VDLGGRRKESESSRGQEGEEKRGDLQQENRGLCKRQKPVSKDKIEREEILNRAEIIELRYQTITRAASDGTSRIGAKIRLPTEP
jgi:hypothetical protein